jgi:hypothetical protein
MHSVLRIPGHDSGHGLASLLITECYLRGPGWRLYKATTFWPLRSAWPG